jgi:hypothetical protein
MKPALVPLAIALFTFAGQLGLAQTPAAEIPTTALIDPAQVATLVRSKAKKPLILQVGSHVLFQQAHIPGSEYVGAASTADGRQQLRNRVASLSKDKLIILYCGCCPWDHCPNVKPAYQELHSAGFTNLKVMYIAHNFGSDWVDKGFPTSKGD